MFSNLTNVTSAQYGIHNDPQKKDNINENFCRSPYNENYHSKQVCEGKFQEISGNICYNEVYELIVI